MQALDRTLEHPGPAHPWGAELSTTQATIDERGRWFCSLSHGPVGLQAKPVLRLLLASLAYGRRVAPGATVSHQALILSVWPGERAFEWSFANRIRVGVATLRRMGLREEIVTAKEGYYLARSARICSLEIEPLCLGLRLQPHFPPR